MKAGGLKTHHLKMLRVAAGNKGIYKASSQYEKERTKGGGGT